MCEYESTARQVCALMGELFGPDLANLTSQDWDKLLTGPPCYLGWRELVYLYLEIQRHFSVLLDVRAVRDQRFASITGIVSSIKPLIHQ